MEGYSQFAINISRVCISKQDRPVRLYYIDWQWCKCELSGLPKDRKRELGCGSNPLSLEEGVRRRLEHRLQAIHMFGASLLSSRHGHIFIRSLSCVWMLHFIT